MGTEHEGLGYPGKELGGQLGNVLVSLGKVMWWQGRVSWRREKGQGSHQGAIKASLVW